MNGKIFLSTFMTILLAEMGDKTQLTAISLVAGGQSRLGTFVACSLALMVSTALAVSLGHLLVAYVPLLWLRRAAAAGFLLMGLTMLWQGDAP